MAEQGYGLTLPTLRRLRRILRRAEREPVFTPPANITRGVSYGDTFPHRLAKPASGQSFDGSTPTVATFCDIYAGDPGSEVVVEEDVPVFQGRQLQSSETIADTEWVIVGEVNGVLQLVSPRTTGGGGSGNMHWVWVTLPSALTQAQASKAGCTVVDRFGDGSLPAISSTITVENPETSVGGVYQFKIASGARAQAIGNGTRYVIVMPQLVTQAVVEDLDWTTPNLTQDLKDVQVLSSDNPRTETILTGTPCAE